LRDYVETEFWTFVDVGSVEALRVPSFGQLRVLGVGETEISVSAVGLDGDAVALALFMEWKPPDD